MAILRDVKITPGQRAVVADISDPEVKKRLGDLADEVLDLLRQKCKGPVETIFVLRLLIETVAKVFLGGAYEGMIELGSDETEGKDA